jgi:thiol-disulfide isomerase/thioredoxin
MRTLLQNTVLAAAANIALILACVAVCADQAVDLYSRLHEPITPPAPIASTARAGRPMPFHAGTKAPEVSGVDYARSDRTLVLFLSTKCKFCKMSAPFYTELARKLRGNGRRRVVAVFPQASAAVDEFKSAQSLACETIPDVQFSEFGVSGTPTMLLVSRDGTVIQAWAGAPDERTKKAIVSAIVL